jgi:predicted CXXCH cytochrome family protein
MGCETCHTMHKTGDATKTEFSMHLNKAPPELCFDCHDVKDAALAKAHQGQPIEKSNCITCHDPHDSSSPKLLQKFAHAPFAAGSCDTCHAPSKDGKVVLTQADAKTLCVSCHDEKAKQIESAKVQHPGAAGDCTDCHNPHAGKSPGFPKPDAVGVCLGCHTDQAEQYNKRVLHQPAFKQGCAICHEPHGGGNAHLLRAANTNALCLECHGPDAKPEMLEGASGVAIFDKRVRLPADYFRKVVRLPLKYGIGHPVERHPVADLSDPSQRKIKKSINCLACHQPHSSAQPNLLVKDQANNMAFCATCHEEYKK